MRAKVCINKRIVLVIILCTVYPMFALTGIHTDQSVCSWQNICRVVSCQYDRMIGQTDIYCWLCLYKHFYHKFGPLRTWADIIDKFIIKAYAPLKYSLILMRSGGALIRLLRLKKLDLCLLHVTRSASWSLCVDGEESVAACAGLLTAPAVYRKS